MLRQLKIAQFKNYAAQEIEFSPRLNGFVGPNGSGKTNLLDAVHFLCLARSHAGLNDRNLLLHGSEFFRLEGHFEHEGVRTKIVAKYLPGQPKIFEKNDVPYPRLADHIGQFPVVMIAPDDIALVQEGSEERRRFLDATLSQISPEYLSNLLVYNHLLRQRNALLKRFFEEKRFDAVLLSVLDEQLPAPAAVVFEHRKNFARAFEPLFLELYAAISGGDERASVAYDSSVAEGENFSEKLAASVERDRYLQRTSVGPHRDDLNLFLADLPAKKFASQGQLKSFLLALRLAQFELLRREKGASPLLLLDDIFDKLDEARVRQLVALLFEREFGQIFITDTHRERLEKVLGEFGAERRVFEVRAGAFHLSS